MISIIGPGVCFEPAPQDPGNCHHALAPTTGRHRYGELDAVCYLPSTPKKKVVQSQSRVLVRNQRARTSTSREENGSPHHQSGPCAPKAKDLRAALRLSESGSGVWLGDVIET